MANKGCAKQVDEILQFNNMAIFVHCHLKGLLNRPALSRGFTAFERVYPSLSKYFFKVKNFLYWAINRSNFQEAIQSKNLHIFTNLRQINTIFTYLAKLD